MEIGVPLRVFCCCAPEDKELQEQLDIHLAVLKRARQILVWGNLDIKAGLDYQQEIDKHLNTAEIILLLVTPNFLAFGQCNSIMQRAFKRWDRREDVRIVPILLRSADWEATLIGKIQILPSDKRPIMESSSPGELFVQVAGEIRKIANTLIRAKEEKARTKVSDYRRIDDPRIDIFGLDGDGKQELSRSKGDELKKYGYGRSEEHVLLEQVEFITNSETRFPIALVIDTSAAMKGAPIAILNEGLQSFHADVVSNPILSRRLECVIITCGGRGVQIIHPLTTMDDCRLPLLESGGERPLGAGINTALGLLEARKTLYRENGTAYYRPWVFLIASGQSSDKCTATASRIRKMELKKSIKFFAIGLDDSVMPFLARITVRKAVQLQGLRFIEMFEWIARGIDLTSTAGVLMVRDLPPFGDWVKYGRYEIHKSWMDEGE